MSIPSSGKLIQPEKAGRSRFSANPKSSTGRLDILTRLDCRMARPVLTRLGEGLQGRGCFIRGLRPGVLAVVGKKPAPRLKTSFRFPPYPWKRGQKSHPRPQNGKSCFDEDRLWDFQRPRDKNAENPIKNRGCLPFNRGIAKAPAKGKNEIIGYPRQKKHTRRVGSGKDAITNPLDFWEPIRFHNKNIFADIGPRRVL